MTAQQSKAAATPRPKATHESTAESKATVSLCQKFLPKMTANQNKGAAILRNKATDDSRAEQGSSYTRAKSHR